VARAATHRALDIDDRFLQQQQQQNSQQISSIPEIADL